MPIQSISRYLHQCGAYYKSRYPMVMRNTPQLLLVMGLFCIGIATLGVLFLSQQVTQQESFDTRKEASVEVGAISVASPAGLSLLVQDNQRIPIQIMTDSRGSTGIQLVFNMITDTFQEPRFVASPGFTIAYAQTEQTTDGYLATVFLVSEVAITEPILSPGNFRDLFYIEVSPTKAGSIQLNFDIEKSVAPAHGISPTQDILTHIPLMRFTVTNAQYTLTPSPSPVTTISPTPTLPTQAHLNDDFSFLLLEQKHKTFSFYLPNSTTQVKQDELVPGKQYRVVHVAYVQNTNKQAIQDFTPVELQFRVHGQSLLTKYLARKTIAEKPEGAQITFDTTFIANATNQFTLTIDPQQKLTDTNRNNNTWTTPVFRYKEQTGTGGPTYYQCNQRCTNNNQCAPGHRCFDTGPDKRCRLVTNVSSTTCRAASSTTPTPTSAVLTTQSCNQQCASNNDCATNFRCYYSSCRLATNPASTTCVPATQKIISSSYDDTNSNKGGISPIATTRITPTPTVLPTVSGIPVTPTRATSLIATGSAQPATTSAQQVTISPTQPIVTPTPSEDPTPSTPDVANNTSSEQNMLDTLQGMVQSWMNTALNNDYAEGNKTLLFWVLLGGLALVIIALLAYVLQKGSSHKAHQVTPTGTVAKKPATAPVSPALTTQLPPANKTSLSQKPHPQPKVTLSSAPTSQQQHQKMPSISQLSPKKESSTPPLVSPAPVRNLPKFINKEAITTSLPVKQTPFPSTPPTPQPIAQKPPTSTPTTIHESGTAPQADTSNKPKSSMLARIEHKHIKPPVSKT